ncbi:MAG: outer membrane beta-barrel protein [Bacteroidales bacterium]|nr:outer membrane beta-barrel protein [Bacteroidales bacterium]
MKKIKKTFFIILFLCFISISNAQDIRINSNVGIAPNRLTDWSEFNYNIDLMVNTNIWNKFYFGLGSSYLGIDLLPSNNYLTFDKKILSFYSSFIYEINLTNKIKLLPEIQLGYSLVHYKLNEMNDIEQKTNGLYLVGGLSSSFYISKHVDLLAGFNYTTIFSELKPSSRITFIPAIYLGIPEDRIKQYLFKVGVIYYFKKRS